MRIRALVVAMMSLVILAGAGPANANLSVGINRLASGLNRPAAIAAPADGSHRVFIVERIGRIRVYRNGSLISGSFLDIQSKVMCCSSEEGMLGLAFHPNYASNGKFYVTYTDNEQDLRVSEFTIGTPSGNNAPESSERILLQIGHRNALNHWGGALQFGSKYLYISTGDGGAGQSGNAQNKSSLLGKILRINVDAGCSGRRYCIPGSNPFAGSTPGDGEIWHYGLRNPWKFSLDTNGDMWIGDVGEQTREEIDRTTSQQSGKNFGWDCREGTQEYTGCSGTFTGPLFNYRHASGRCAIIGGSVARGSDKAPTVNGWYIFADYCTGEIWGLKRTSGSPTIDALYNHGRNITTLGASEAGNIYFTSIGSSQTDGRLYRLED